MLDDIVEAFLQYRKLKIDLEGCYIRRYDRNEAIARAYLSGRHTMAAIAEHFEVHYTTVSRLVRAYEEAREE